jgi:hypothetical protein
MPRSVSLVGLARKGVIPQNNSITKCSFYDPVVIAARGKSQPEPIKHIVGEMFQP